MEYHILCMSEGKRIGVLDIIENSLSDVLDILEKLVFIGTDYVYIYDKYYQIIYDKKIEV